MDDKIHLNGYLAGLLSQLNIGDVVEVYLGDVKTVSKQADFDHYTKNIIVGKIIDCVGDCLILSVQNTHDKKNSGKVLINAWQIKTIIPYNEPVYIKDIYSDEHEGFGSGITKLITK